MRLVIFISTLKLISTLATDNEVLDRPEVQCGVDTISVNVMTKKAFKGRIYVDGESDKSHCVQSGELGNDRTTFSLPIGACNMRRQRTLHPRGISFTFTMIVSFHPFFVTGMDRAFSIRCFFLESIKSLDAKVDVGTLAPETVDQEFSLPVCTYQLREGVQGPVIRFAQVGQQVSHVWTCDHGASHVYGILIHSCYADDGRGNKFELVDDRGCSTDPFLLPQLEYEHGSISAFTNANVFKYADKVQLYFTCTVQLCYKHDGGCEGITPPRCDGHSDHGFLPSHPEVHQEGPPKEFTQQDGPEFPHPSGPPKEFIHLPLPNPGLPLGIPQFTPPPNVEAPILKTNAEIEPVRRAPSRDSPLNETDAMDDVESTTFADVATTRGMSSVIEEILIADAEFVTFKPISVSTTTTKRPSVKTDVKKNKMETDVTVDFIVLPVEDKEKGSPPLGLINPKNEDLCFSRSATAILTSLILLTIFLTSGTVYLCAQRFSSRFPCSSRNQF